MNVVVRQDAPSGSAHPSRTRLREIAERRFERSVEVPTRFFEEHADAIANACLGMARRFEQGGRLLVFGVGAEATDAHHVSVEFVHPVLVGKRALPAVALTSDVASLTGTGRGASLDDMFARTLATLGRERDIALGITRDGNGEAILRGLARARQLGMLTLGLGGGDGGRLASLRAAEFLFIVSSTDPLVIQEVHETLYHVLWELVHVFFEHRVTGG
jgi:D-sedoheptulose 7-phosphate isomerase